MKNFGRGQEDQHSTTLVQEQDPFIQDIDFEDNPYDHDFDSDVSEYDERYDGDSPFNRATMNPYPPSQHSF